MNNKPDGEKTTMTQQQDNKRQNDNQKPELEKGEEVKVPDIATRHKAVVTETSGEKVTAILLEGSEKGEEIEYDRDKLESHQPEAFIALLPQAWGVAKSREQAIINASVYFDHERHDEKVTLYTAKIHRDYWEVTNRGTVRSKFIKSEKEIQASSQLVDRIKDVSQDNKLLAEALMDEGETDNQYESFLEQVKEQA